MWSLCLSLPAAGRREIVQLDGATATVQDLFRSAEEAVSGSNDGQLVLKAGFPPVALDAESTQTLQEAGLSNQDKITVTVKEEEKAKSTAKKKTTTKAAAKKATGGTTSKTAKQQQRKRPPKKQQAPESDSEHEEESEESQTTPVASPSHPPRSRRAAAQKATESFAEVIQAQEEALQQQKKPATGKKLSNAATRPPKKRPPAKFTATSAGRRLQDGAVVAAASRKRSRRSQPLANGGDNGNDDPSLALLGTLESSSKAGRVLRKGWRKAVENTFEQNKAVARLAACEAGRVQFSVQGRNVNTASTMPQQLCVTFAKGVQGRGDFEETVDFLPRDVLQHVVASIHPTNPEALRPSNLALLSPRVLWSLAYHHCQQVNNEKAAGESKTIPTDIAAALQALQPDLDWSFLRRRKQELSAKARENLRQQQEQETSVSSVGEDWEAAAAAIASVEQAMEEVHVVDRSHRAAQALQAAERRQQEQEDQPSWQLETPNELDEDELLECVQECVPEQDNALATSNDNAKEWVRRLIEGCGVHNWRELANVVDAEGLAQQLSLPSNHDDKKEGADQKMPKVSVEVAQAWLNRARMESVDEIMVEVCDGNVPAVSLLMEHAQTATPRDLENWTSICDELHKVLVEATSSPNNDSNNRNGNVEDKNETHPPEVPSVVLLQKWCRQADMARDQIPWLAGMTSAI